MSRIYNKPAGDLLPQVLLDSIPFPPGIHHHPALRFLFHHFQIAGPHPLVEIQLVGIQTVPFTAAGLAQGAPLQPDLHVQVQQHGQVRYQAAGGVADQCPHLFQVLLVAIALVCQG